MYLAGRMASLSGCAKAAHSVVLSEMRKAGTKVYQKVGEMGNCSVFWTAVPKDGLLVES